MATTTPAPHTGARCTIAKILDTFEEEESRTFFANAMDGNDPDYAVPSAASRLAVDMGHRISPAIVRRHRRRLTRTGEMCWCPA